MEGIVKSWYHFIMEVAPEGVNISHLCRNQGSFQGAFMESRFLPI
jgi:hypothetical protein